MAMIIPEHQLMFVMVPATGCTAVGQVLQKRFDAEWFPPEDVLENNKRIPR
jgi:hypothetical protein